jgi:hypothetical protein
VQRADAGNYVVWRPPVSVEYLFQRHLCAALHALACKVAARFRLALCRQQYAVPVSSKSFEVHICSRNRPTVVEVYGAVLALG